jgi:hypothetical protein
MNKFAGCHQEIANSIPNQIKNTQDFCCFYFCIKCIVVMLITQCGELSRGGEKSKKLTR